MGYEMTCCGMARHGAAQHGTVLYGTRMAYGMAREREREREIEYGDLTTISPPTISKSNLNCPVEQVEHPSGKISILKVKLFVETIVVEIVVKSRYEERERERETEGGRRRRQGDARRGVGEAAAAAGEVHRVLPGRAAAAPGQPRAEVPAGRVPRGRQPVARRPRGLGDPGGETPPRPGSLPGVGGGGGGGCARGVRYVCVCVPGRLTGSQLVDFTPGVCVCVCVCVFLGD